MIHFIDSLKRAETEKTHIFSVGQAGYIIKSKEGKTIGIDLYLSDCVEADEGHVGFHRLLPKIINPEELVLDVLIATHFHKDHFDIGSVKQLMDNGHTMLYCAYDCEEDVDKLGIDKGRVFFIKPGDTAVEDKFKLSFIHCDHGTGAPKAVGVIITVDGKNILEVGDTCLHLDWKDEYLKEGNLDVLIAPINGAYGNLNEQENIKLTAALKPGLTIPCHFGMFASHGGNPGLWKDLIDAQIPRQDYKLFTMGESIEL